MKYLRCLVFISQSALSFSYIQCPVDYGASCLVCFAQKLISYQQIKEIHLKADPAVKRIWQIFRYGTTSWTNIELWNQFTHDIHSIFGHVNWNSCCYFNLCIKSNHWTITWPQYIIAIDEYLYYAIFMQMLLWRLWSPCSVINPILLSYLLWRCTSTC